MNKASDVLKSWEVNALVDFFFYYMPMEMRQNLMLSLPQVYDKMIGEPTKRVPIPTQMAAPMPYPLQEVGNPKDDLGIISVDSVLHISMQILQDVENKKYSVYRLGNVKSMPGHEKVNLRDYVFEYSNRIYSLSYQPDGSELLRIKNNSSQGWEPMLKPMEKNRT